MTKLNQKIVLFIEPAARVSTPSKIGNLFMNRFAIDEDPACEILKIIELKSNFYNFHKNRLTKEQGLDLKKIQIIF